MPFVIRLLVVGLVAVCLGVPPCLGQPEPPIPLPEHPRPDFQRPDWVNLNGPWELRFDPDDAGLEAGWASAHPLFPLAIDVPFPWGSRLSGVADEADIAWYRRVVDIPEAWAGRRVFLVVGACDWHTTAWVDGAPVGEHRGGYTPFELELTAAVRPGSSHLLVLRVDDSPAPLKLEGKQGYGEAKGIWQTAYLEARPRLYLDSIEFHPDLGHRRVEVHARLSEAAPAGARLRLDFASGGLGRVEEPLEEGAAAHRVEVPIPDPRLWSLEDPFLYELRVRLETPGSADDEVGTYFGMREIGVVDLPGLGHPYIALNGEPVYLQMTLDQAYHPDGFYTFPSDAFMRDEILRARRLGLNGIRTHVKIDVPRKLYWADRLGVLVMADVPNSWGEPDAEMRAEIETALRGMMRRDFNHPAIFSWVLFNETWGLRTEDQGYLPATQDWVAEMYRLAKRLDPTRLVEDNSPNREDHVVTDINSWHAYLPGFAWEEHLDQISRDTFPGSSWNFAADRTQDRQPNLNSECGNVWGYEGSTGDVDWSWDYHLMLDAFRRHPKVSGWLYTEHHDVINEWNGYYRFDRSGKQTGLGAIVPGMSLRDLHAPFYVALGGELCRSVAPGATASVPLWASFMLAESTGPGLRLRSELFGWDVLGNRRRFSEETRDLAFEPWLSRKLPPLEVALPEEPGLAVLAVFLEDSQGTVRHRNFTTFRVAEGPSPRDETVSHRGGHVRLVRFAPNAFQDARWSQRQWQVLEGLKVNGAGWGFFEYRIPWPPGLDVDAMTEASFRAELSAKQLFGKDRPDAEGVTGDFMRGRGTHDPSVNPNAYPMTDGHTTPSAVRVRLGGEAIGLFDLEDDPADHRGILSWCSQKRDGRLREAGSYGYLITAPIPLRLLREAQAVGSLVLRLEVDAALPGGLAVYGERFGRFPLDPTLAFTLKE